jgi:ABC-2 type transport system ATP-binding protein
MAKDDIAIKVDSINKTFKLPHEKITSIKSAVVNFYRHKRSFEKQKVLKDVSFEIKKGEFFGIVGRNGSGKSTLLKLLAGIYTPDSGSVNVNGTLTPFIELGVGFSPELTGRDNVFLNGALLGFSRKQMEKMYNDIVEFAELERFMDQKLKNYSSGMQVRLAFSIAIRAHSDILLIDEVLAVGDENFQRKCYNYFSKVKKEGKTIIFVSHDMDAVGDFCSRAILVHDGEIIEAGPSNKVIAKYREINFSKIGTDLLDQKKNDESLRRWGNGDANIDKVWTSLKRKERLTFKPEEKIEVNVDISAKSNITTPVIGMILQDSQGRVVFATNTKELGTKVKDLTKGEKIRATFNIDNVFTNGNYSVSCAVANFDRTLVYSRVEEAHTFAITGWSMPHSITHPDHVVTISAA